MSTGTIAAVSGGFDQLCEGVEGEADEEEAAKYARYLELPLGAKSCVNGVEAETSEAEASVLPRLAGSAC